MVSGKEILASTKIPAKRTGKRAEQGNSTIVIIMANSITTVDNIKIFFFLENIFSTFGDNLEIIPLELQVAPCFLDLKYSRAKYIPPIIDSTPINISMLLI